MFLYHFAGDTCPLDWGQSSSSCFYLNASSLVLLGILVNGPYALISTAVSVNLGTHHSLRVRTIFVANDQVFYLNANVYGPFLNKILCPIGSFKPNTFVGTMQQTINYRIFAYIF